jgi:ribosomal protein S18 acetylase RimI-like enzyme
MSIETKIPCEVVYTVESFSLAIPKILALVERHYDEAAALRSKLPLSLDMERYEYLSNGAQALCFLASSGKEVIGYLVASVFRHSHCEAMASNMDGVYVLPEHRGNGIASALKSLWEADMKQRGVKILAASTPVNAEPSNLFGEDWTKTDIIRTKWIGG